MSVNAEGSSQTRLQEYLWTQLWLSETDVGISALEDWKNEGTEGGKGAGDGGSRVD